ncbi:MAG TPA: hypothetical protein VM260_27245, partial [Pirellula sp.]|nr:hypothetical protein [Pirellula sp.]
MREIFRCLTLLMLVSTMLGCGGDPYGPTGKVTGKLTMDGKVLPAGHAVSFMQMDKGFLAFGMTDDDGKFEVKSWNSGDMPIGKYDVMIAPPSGGDASNLSAEERFEKPDMSSPKSKVQFPTRYRETTTSG